MDEKLELKEDIQSAEGEKCTEEGENVAKKGGCDKWKRRMHINRSFIPLKMIYFFFMAGEACVLPYRAIFMKHLGLSTKQTGLIWTIERVISILLPPSLGAITDKSRRPKLVLIVLLVVGSSLLFSMYFVPQEASVSEEKNRTATNLSEEEISHHNTSMCWTLECEESKNQCIATSAFLWEPACDGISGLNIIETIECTTLAPDGHSSIPVEANQNEPKNSTLANNTISNDNSASNDCLLHWSTGESTSVTLTSHYMDAVVGGITGGTVYADAERLCVNYTSASSASVDSCGDNASDSDEYGATFWLIFFLVVSSACASIGCYPVMESGVLGALGPENRHRFGQQRLWASVGYGSAALLVGYFKDRSSDAIGVAGSSNRPFLPMFAGVVVCWIIAAFVAKRLPISVNTQDRQKVRMKDVRFVLMRPKAVAFYSLLLFYGMDNAIQEIYLFWLAENKLNAPTSILGACALAGSLLDIPFCIAAGTLIRRFGHTSLICFGVTTFSVRLLLAAIVTEPWQLIAVESLKGVTWGLTWVVTCSYTAKIAPRGLEVSTMGLTQATMRGVGYGTGAILGGILFEVIGGENVFLLFGGLSLFASILYGIYTFCTRKKSSDDANDVTKAPDNNEQEASLRSSDKVIAEEEETKA